MKSLKTHLRYPGEKLHDSTKMDSYFPDLREYKEFREPFLGGGSVAIHITKKYPNLDIWVNDLYEPLVNFWQQLQMFGTEMKNDLIQLKNRHCEPVSAKFLFQESKTYLEVGEDSYWKALSFYVVNKCSFSGLVSSSFSPMASDSNFSVKNIESLNVNVDTDFINALKHCDAVNMLRIQNERMSESYFPSVREYVQQYGLNKSILDSLNEKIIVMHPGPINRGVEITSEVADSDQAIILDQVENGVAIRMAVMYLLAAKLK